MRVIDLQNWRDLCTGCHACVAICPHKAIGMNYEGDGFLYPQIDIARCIDCGLCAQACPIAQKERGGSPLRVVSGRARDREIVRQSSSGGMFKLLAQRTLAEGGVVFGAAFDADEQEVRHCSTDEVPLESLLRSKYVQSRIGNAYACAEQALKDGRRVLFCATPCQIHGLECYLHTRGVEGRLETVDFVCHGVPSPGFFQSFLRQAQKERQSKVTNVTFREKDKGWRTQVTKLYFADGTVWTKESLKHPYYFFFLKDYCLRDSCYRCKAYRTHAADLTLADDWITSLPKDDAGTSLVFVNTNTGNRMLADVREAFECMDVSNEVNDMEVYSHASYDHRKKQAWLYAWQNKGFSYVSGRMHRRLSRKAWLLSRVRIVTKAICRRLKIKPSED